MTNRREFLRTAGSTAALLGLNESGKAARAKKVMVAGGGIAGLCCAYELTRRGHEVTVLEASDRVGGHVKTLRTGLPDGLYVDAGAEQFTKPGYELYWSYVREFNLPYLQDHRREQMLRRIDERMYSEEDLSTSRLLNSLGLNGREVKYLQKNPWWSAASLYFDKYSEAITDEYQPFVKSLARLDEVSVNQMLQRDGASDAYIRHFGGEGSALHAVWHAGILKKRGVPLWPTQVFRLIGGNSLLPETFAKHLGARVKRNCPVTAIRHSDKGVTVDYRESSSPKSIDAEYLVCCMSAVMLRQIPVTPAWDDRKRWAVSSVPYYSATRPIFLARSKFWREQRTSINREFRRPELSHVWSMADDVTTERGMITGTAQPGVSAQRALEAFRSYNPTEKDTIESAMIVDWSRDPWCMACETTSYRPGELKKFWPTIVEPQGRIHFAGAYCDNLNWGQEAATRSAHRVAKAIDAA